MTEDWIFIQEVAEILDIDRFSVYYYIHNGSLVSEQKPHSNGGTGYFFAISRASAVALRESWEHKMVPAYEFSPSDTECAYLAGLIDGEGSIIIRQRNHARHTLHLSIANTYEPVLDWVAKTFGATKSHVYRKQRIRDNMPVFAWTALAFRAYHVLCVTLPYLIIKREQALIGIQFQEEMTRRRGHRGRRLTEDDLSWREQQRQRLQALNKSRYLYLPASEADGGSPVPDTVADPLRDH